MNNVTNTPPFFDEEESNDFNLKEILFKYLAYWPWFLASLLLSISCAFIYLRYQTPIYIIETSVLIKDSKNSSSQSDLLKELDMFSSNKVVDNEIEILKSYTLMEKVVKKLNLHVSYQTKGKFKKNDIYTQSPIHVKVLNADNSRFGSMVLKVIDGKTLELDGKIINPSHKINTPYGLLKFNLTGKNLNIKELIITINSIEDIAESYANRIKIAPSSKMSSVLSLTIEDAQPLRGEDILNTLIEVYNDAGLEDKNKVTANTLRFIDNRLVLISGDLIEVEKSVENYKSRQGITDITSESELFLESVKENDNQLNQLKIQQSVLNNIDLYIRNKQNRPGTAPATLGISDPILLGLIQTLSELESKRTQAISIVKEDNPMVKVLDDQILEAKSSLKENIQSLQRSLAITRQQLENQNNRMEGLIKSVPGKERALVDISRQQAIKNNLYIYLLQKREETALSYASEVSDSRIINTARAAKSPVKPVSKNIYSIFALLGFAIPFALIYIIDLLNDKVKSRKDIEKATKVPIIGEISNADHDEALVVSNLGRTVMAEQIRALRTNMSFLNPGKELRTILFTSSISGEGKSFISLNLGASLAMTGKKTIILELDMRKPKLHVVLKMENNKGLSNYLIGKVELKDIIREIPGQENYYIISCGPIPPNPAELLLNGRLKELFTDLKKDFDYVIIDAPPVGVVTDAQILEQEADATLFVIRHDYTPKERLKMIDNLYRERKFKNLNLVFNGIKEGGKYGYSYGYGYGYYEQKNGKENKLTMAINGIKKQLNGEKKKV